MSSTYQVALTLRTLADVPLINFDDHANGYSVLSGVDNDTQVWRRMTSTSPYVDGDFETAKALAGSVYAVRIRVDGVTWAEQQGRVEAMRATWQVGSMFHLDETIEGVTRRFRARTPDLTTEALVADRLLLRSRVYLLEFPVQPNPTVTGV